MRKLLTVLLSSWTSIATAQTVNNPIIPPGASTLFPLNNTWTGSNLFNNGLNAGASPSGTGSWITTWDSPGAYLTLNPMQSISKNGSRALSLYSRQSDYAGGGIFSPETMVIITIIDQAPPAGFQGSWGEYVEFDQSWTGNLTWLNVENDAYTKTANYCAAVAADPYMYNGYTVTATPTYSGSTLTLSNISANGFGGRAPIVNSYVQISGITGTTGTNPNGFYQIASVSGSGPYTLTFTIPGVVGTPGGTPIVLLAGHSAGYRLAAGAGRGGSNNISSALDIIGNTGLFDTGILFGSNSLDTTTATATSATHSSGIAVLTFSATPSWAVIGGPIFVSGATGDTAINGTYTILGFNATQIYYAVGGSGSPTGTITATRLNAPAVYLPEQYGIRWAYNAGAGNGSQDYADIFENQSGGFPQLHFTMPQANSSISFEFGNGQSFGINSTTFFPAFTGQGSLGTTSSYFAGVYSIVSFLKPVNIAGLTACSGSTAGLSQYVSDSTATAAPTWHGVISGGGATSVNALAFCNGSNWIWQ